MELREHAEGVLLPVRASPGAKRNAITGEHDGALRVSVTAPPDKGRANDAIVKVLAKSLQLRAADVRLLTGATSRRKQFLVVGGAMEELREQIAVVLAGQ